jgi:hypothetical protein
MYLSYYREKYRKARDMVILPGLMTGEGCTEEEILYLFRRKYKTVRYNMYL